MWPRRRARAVVDRRTVDPLHAMVGRAIDSCDAPEPCGALCGCASTPISLIIYLGSTGQPKG